MFGRKAIIWNAVAVGLLSAAAILIYMIVLSSILAEFVGAFFNPPKAFGEVWYSSKPFYLFLISASLLFVVIKKDLKEVSILATLLVVSIGIFILCSLVLLILNGEAAINPLADNDIWVPKKSGETLGAVCTIFVAYGYQINVFPIYDSMKEQTVRSFRSA